MTSSLRLFTTQPDVAKKFQDRLAIKLCDRESDHAYWALNYINNQLTLCGLIDNTPFKLAFDLLSGQMNFRKLHGGGRKEPLAKAVGVKGEIIPSVIDATAGMGREAYLLAYLGCQVTALERQPITFLLLQDAIARAKLESLTGSLQLIHIDSIEYLSSLAAEQFPDVVYLDPMFPARDKSAAVKKEMRIFKKLAGEDLDDSELLKTALNAAKKRVVVKRPNYAPFVGDLKPSHQIESKKHRFDVYMA